MEPLCLLFDHSYWDKLLLWYCICSYLYATIKGTGPVSLVDELFGGETDWEVYLKGQAALSSWPGKNKEKKNAPPFSSLFQNYPPIPVVIDIPTGNLVHFAEKNINLIHGTVHLLKHGLPLTEIFQVYENAIMPVSSLIHCFVEAFG